MRRVTLLPVVAAAAALSFATAARAEEKAKPTPAAKAVAKKAEKAPIVIPLDVPVRRQGPIDWMDVVHVAPSLPIAPLKKPAASLGAAVEKDPF
jgi:hypothetical protein